MSAAQLAHGLAAYLCGTKRRPPDPRSLAAAHAALAPDADGDTPIGAREWEGRDETARLRARLFAALTTEDVVDLILYGSQARGTTTGYSDVDAVLVVADEAAADAARLERLRPRVLAAQRAVLRHQPMQHHGFEVATPTLLRRADEALTLPRLALGDSRSLFGHGGLATWRPDAPGRAVERFRSLGRAVRRDRWPRHVWEAHRLVSMFELLPALYLQARGDAVDKPQSFARAAEEFGVRWWPYDALAHVRDAWPRDGRPLLAAVAVAARNPWLAVAAWRRCPGAVPAGVAPLLTPKLLRGLHELVDAMDAEVP